MRSGSFREADIDIRLNHDRGYSLDGGLGFGFGTDGQEMGLDCSLANLEVVGDLSLTITTGK